MAVEWPTAASRIHHMQRQSAYDYKRSRELRNGKNFGPAKAFREIAARNSAKGRDMLFALIDQKLPPDYTGWLKDY